jgi:predicted phage terminase large subunit-like protein
MRGATRWPRVRKRCKTLAQFVREAWIHLPELSEREYVHGWHIDLVCAHLEAITFGRLKDLGLENRLAINVPPGTMKSLLVSVFWPAWEWSIGFGHYQYVATSYRLDFCKRDTQRMRDLVISEWYQSLFGQDYYEVKGENRKRVRGIQLVIKGELHIQNSIGGNRKGIPFESLTGARGDRLIIDDPQSNATGESEKHQERDEKTFRDDVPKRLNHPDLSAIVVVQQRVNIKDTSGLIDKLKLPYVRLVLPMRFEPERRCVTPIGRDPRRHEGELLFPQYMTKATVDRDEAGMTKYAIDGQHQQRPTPREGRTFKREWFTQRIPAPPARARRCRGWDLAASKKKAGKFTASTRMSITGDGIVVIEHATQLKDTPAMVEKHIKAMATMDDALMRDQRTRISIPQDPGQAGVAQRNHYAKDVLPGHDVRFSPESGEKNDRALPLSAQAEIGNVRIVETGDPDKDAWIEPWIEGLMTFPSGEFTDVGDSASRAYMTLLTMPPIQDDVLFVTQVRAERHGEDYDE